MNSIAFWKSWSKTHQFIFWLLAISFLTYLGFFWYSYFIYPAPTIVWDQFQQLNIEPVTLRTFTIGSFEIPVYADNYLIFEILSGSEPNTYKLPYYLFLVVMLFTSSVLLSIVSTMSRYWFIIGMGVFTFLVMIMPFDSMQIFGLSNKIPAIIILILFAGVSYFFHAWQTHYSFERRLLTFSFLFTLLAIIISTSNEQPGTILYFAAGWFSLGFILCVICILSVAHEIPVAFINVVTRGTGQTKSLQHFILISAFYLINLFLAYGIKTGYLDLNLWTVDLYFLLTISSVLCIWGFRQREPQFESFFPADPIGVYFMISLAISAFGTIGYFMATANDTVLIVIKDIIIYSHLGFGLIFLFYVFANFGSMLTKNLQVYKVLYKPNTMPYFTFRLMGLICTFGFLVFDTNWRTPISQTFASYYNSLGDIELLLGNTEEAEGIYKKSVFFRNQNHHAHYALAAINAAKLEPQTELSELISASESHPPEQTLVNLIDAYRRSDRTADAVQTIERAEKNSLNKSALLNTKGLIYMQLNMSDSSLISFQKARREQYMKDISETNLIAASAHFALTYPADSLLLLLQSDKEGAKSNALALANMQQQYIEIDFNIGADTTLNATRAALLCNYIINQRKKIDTMTLNQSTLLARKPVNESFKEHIMISCAQAFYSKGMVKRAFELAREVAYTYGKGKYFALLGTWALEQNNPMVASDYYAIASEKNQYAANYYEAVATAETGNLMEAWIKFENVLVSEDSIFIDRIKRFLSMIESTPSQLKIMDDESKYLYCRYKLNLVDSAIFKSIIQTIGNEEFKTRAIVEYASKWYAQDEPSVAAGFLNLADGLIPEKETTLAAYYFLHGMLLSDSHQWEKLIELIKEDQLVNIYYPNAIPYWNALLNQHKGNIEQTSMLFQYLSQANMYFDEAVVASARYWREQAEDPLKPYSILVNGIMARPNSVKILKEYIKQAALIGFDKEATEGIEKLRVLISTRAFNLYLKENPDYFSLE